MSISDAIVETAKPDRLTPDDISKCFLLFLARTPEDTASYSRWIARPIAALISEMLSLEYFKNEVLTPVLIRGALPHVSVTPTPSWALLDWVQHRMPLSPTTRRAVGLVRSWDLLLEITLADPGLINLSTELSTAGIDVILAERVKDEALLQVARAVIGAVDSASAFQVRGWAMDFCNKAARVSLEFYADSIFLGTAECNEPRPDVIDHAGGDGNCGFTFAIPSVHRLLFATGRAIHTIDSLSRKAIGNSTLVHTDPAQSWDSIEATRREIISLRKTLERIEKSLPDLGRLASVPIEAYSSYWDRFYRPSPDLRKEQRTDIAEFGYKPVISIILPTWNSDARFLDAAVRSVLAQTYTRWELIITDDASTSGDALHVLQARYAEGDSRIRLIKADEQRGIAVNTNRGIAAAKGDYFGFLDHDDELASDALFHVVAALQRKHYGLIYSDEDRIEEEDPVTVVHHTPFFKPGFDPDLLLAMNYICHFVVVKRDVLAAVGGFREGFEGAQDHDLLLRITEQLTHDEILHIPRILYHWRVVAGSVSQTLERVTEINRNIVTAVAEHLERTGAKASVETHNDAFGSARGFATRVRWSLPSAAPSISIIVPTRDRLDLLQPCIASLNNSRAEYPGPVELIIVDNDSVEPETLSYFSEMAAQPEIRVIPFHGVFNWSAINNHAAREANGEILLFLNNDTVVLSADWCLELAANAVRPEVGAVGARLLYHDGTLQHAGVALGVEGVAGHESLCEPTGDGGYFGRTHLLRGTSAVTGACLATRRALFLELGGFDELALKVAFNDIDFCMKVRKAGYRVVYNPFAVLYHFESKSRGRDSTEPQQARHRGEAASFRARWGDAIDRDPFYNPHFERYARPFTRLRPPPDSAEPIGMASP